MHMLKLRYADYKGAFHGFVLKEGYFYGYDDATGELVAASGYQSDGNVRIYRLQDGQWNACWRHASVTDFTFVGLEDRFGANHMPFTEWLVSKGYEEDALEKSDLEKLKAIQKEYDLYCLFDGLPQFAVDWLKEYSPEYKRIQDEYKRAQYM